MKLPPKVILFLLMAAVPLFIINRYLMQWIRPRTSAKNAFLYLVAILATAFVYTFLISLVLLKYVWTVK